MRQGIIGRLFTFLPVGLLAGAGCQPGDLVATSCDAGSNPGEGERIGVLESTDGGATWTDLGHACLPAAELTPVDPSPMSRDGRIVLYFFDINSLRVAQGPGVVCSMYSAGSDDGLEFDSPTLAYSTAEHSITDPAVIQLPDGTYRMYLSEGGSVLSAVSSDGVSFTAEEGTRSEVGGVPGILPLPDGRYRLFVCGAGGIVSLISGDGLNFTSEDGVRIASTGGDIICDPHPIRLQDGSYLMTYKVRPAGEEGPNNDQVWLAASDDGLNWTPGSASVATGSVPGIVETDDGRLLIYFVDFSS